MFFLKLCSILIWISVLALAERLKGNPGNPTPWQSQSTSATTDFARMSKCSITPASGNAKFMAYCYGFWPNESLEDCDEVRITKSMQKNLTKVLLDKINNPHIQILRIKDCDVTYIQPNAFGRLQSLILLDLSRNRIERLDVTMFNGLIRLQELILNTNKISHVPLQMFIRLQYLEKLDLYNNQISKIPDLPETVKDLHLGYNKLTQVDSNALKTPNLESLDLCDNAITDYASSFLSRCEKLTSLCIGNKMLESTTSFPFNDVARLKTLTITGDNSDSTPHPDFPNTFKELKELQTLTITNCTLLNWSFLVGLENLQTLSLKWVEVKAPLRKEDFMYCTKLETLDLTGSKVTATQITENQMFVHLQSLKKLILPDCNIEQLGWLPLPMTPPTRRLEPKMLPQLQVLDISNNPLQCREEKTQHALCYLNKITGNFSSSWNHNTDPRIVNHESTTLPSWNAAGINNDYHSEHKFDQTGSPNDHHNNHPNQEKLHFSVMHPEEMKCVDWDQQPVTKINEELCQNFQDSKFPRFEGKEENFLTSESSDTTPSSGLTTETIWYIVLGVILGLLLLTAIILCIVCTKNRRGAQEIRGTDNPQPQSFQALKQATSSQDALIDGHKK